MRRFNYTGRLRMGREHVSVRLKPGEQGRLAYDLALTLGEFKKKLDPDATVVVQLHDGASYARIPLGRLGDLADAYTASGKLEDFSEHQSPAVQVKIIAPKRQGLLAALGRIQPQSGGASLLPITVEPLESEVFRVSFQESVPKLVLNSKLKPVAELGVKYLAKEKSFRALVFPQVLREILSHFLIGSRPHLDDPEDDSPAQKWIEFGKRLTGEAPPAPDSEPERHEWIDHVVEVFARQEELLSEYSKEVR